MSFKVFWYFFWELSWNYKMEWKHCRQLIDRRKSTSRLRSDVGFPKLCFFFSISFLSVLEQSLSPRCNKNQQHRRFHILHCSCVCGRCSHSQRGINISVSGRKSVRCRELKPWSPCWWYAVKLNHSVEMRQWKLNISFIWKKHFFKSSSLSVILKAQMIT